DKILGGMVMRQKKILVVDDDEMNLNIARMILERKLPCKVLTVDNGSDAEKILAFLKKHQIRSINLNNGPLTDIGGILPLKEKAKTDHSYNSIRYNNKKKPNQ
ncbi:MAG: hypothetical protein IKD72_08780, partial [Clostridia bacterium]|nr:hypothetical protein [Clostridia bacterium]